MTVWNERLMLTDTQRFHKVFEVFIPTGFYLENNDTFRITDTRCAACYGHFEWHEVGSFELVTKFECLFLFYMIRRWIKRLKKLIFLQKSVIASQCFISLHRNLKKKIFQIKIQSNMGFFIWDTNYKCYLIVAYCL